MRQERQTRAEGAEGLRVGSQERRGGKVQGSAHISSDDRGCGGYPKLGLNSKARGIQPTAIAQQGIRWVVETEGSRLVDWAHHACSSGRGALSTKGQCRRHGRVMDMVEGARRASGGVGVAIPTAARCTVGGGASISRRWLQAHSACATQAARAPCARCPCALRPGSAQRARLRSADRAAGCRRARCSAAADAGPWKHLLWAGAEAGAVAGSSAVLALQASGPTTPWRMAACRQRAPAASVRSA